MLSFFSTLRNKQISLFMFNFIIAIWLGAILNFGFYKKVHLLTPYLGIKATFFLAATVVIVVATYYAALQILNWKWTAKIFAILLVFIGGFSSYFVNTLGVIISPDQIQNIAQTDVAEATDLLSLRFGLWTIFFVILPIFLITQVKLKSEKILPLLLKKVLSIALAFAVVGGLLFAYYVDFAAIFREHRDLKGMISPQNTISSVMSYYRKKAPKKNLPLVKYGEDAHQVQQTQKDLPKLMVLVVGETARAESFSLNGYAKNTNPELSKQDILNFSQVSSCGTATAVSVPCMFSGMPRADYDEQLASHREGLLDIAKRAGYQVTWIDNNSGCKGACDRVEQYQIPEDLKQKWCKDGECLDGILIDSLKQYLASIPKDDKRPRLVVLHQMGSHGPAYYKRAPEGYQPFKPTCDTNAIQGCSPAELLNSYDNTIVYTDHVLSQMINTLKEVSNYQTGLWYLSDHGESTGEHGMYLHGSPYSIAPSQQTHIPMIMWFSDGWKQHNLAQVNCLNQQTKQKLSQDNLFPSLLSLLDVQTQVINPQLDMLHSCAHVN
ncbi:phosphoethanolamine transferase [Acinetobacter nosocomialis]|uniref:Lipid A phosphoethanolamine transferase n=1 Tax=Acinetobacter nosocomialis TaxID=106654 RepID=A0AB36M3K3_ACINO|nr:MULTISPECIES: phosphoethanolamine--lipid A transferase [Acinetobacter]MBD8352335.1 phosphoethanolamine--lipid A transferase [Acinetobacter nosocomialis]MBJ8462132.1 phosphoethanolamine--lipid A transferase [Acinetobacter nosocomialis]MBJ8493693.1 phosphoethanolamine--lipid A transferase [Acinetobacter nosocomialis]MBJ9725232.1 phosphoethanolamine--lipid A transferase [Acinetobacter nosocomialis]MBO1279074.1 phosphoethanolamine--lipid A transferase [Acinetobacter nosocomialis]